MAESQGILDERQVMVTEREAKVVQREAAVAVREEIVNRRESGCTFLEDFVEYYPYVQHLRQQLINKNAKLAESSDVQVATGRTLARLGGEMNKISHDGRKTTLLSLPAELRDRIFHFAVVGGSPLRVDIMATRRDEDETCWHVDSYRPALALVSRQLRDEVLTVFYRDHEIVIRHGTEHAAYEAEKDLAIVHYLGNYAHYLSLLTATTVYNLSNSPQPERVPLTVRAKLVGHGSLALDCTSTPCRGELRNPPPDWRYGSQCSCDAHQRGAATSTKGKHGRRLLELAANYALGAHAMARLAECKKCKLPTFTSVVRNCDEA